MYESPQKKNSSWTPSTVQKKGKSPSKLGHFSIQPKSNPSSESSQEIGEYSRTSMDRLTANVMRSLQTREQEIAEESIQPKFQSPWAPTFEPPPPLPQSPASQLKGAFAPVSENPIQRQCAECAKEEEEQKGEERKDVEEIGIQTKLTVGAPGDTYEQEADQVAAQVISMPDNSPQVQKYSDANDTHEIWKRAHSIKPVVQRVVDPRVEMGQMVQRAHQMGRNQASSLEANDPKEIWKRAQSIQPVVQRVVDPRVQMREMIQRAHHIDGNQASGNLESRLNASKGGGSPLSEDVRGFMEPRFGADFSGVRVHTGGEAVQMNQELGAQAFTHGSDVYFGQGKQPGNNELTAHELTHVVQQTGHINTKKVIPRIQRDVQLPPLIGPLSQGLPNFFIGRSLSSREISVLRPVFGIHLNYWVIRVCEGGLCTPDGISRTVGNILALEPGFSDDTLIHECAHVWQHQNGVPFGYALSALSSQAIAAIITGSRNAAYDYSLMVRYHIPWRFWNAEQQASWIEDNKRLPNIAVWATGGWLPVA